MKSTLNGRARSLADMISDLTSYAAVRVPLQKASRSGEVTLDLTGYRQINSYACGAVAAAMVVKWLRPQISFEQVYAAVDPSPETGAGPVRVMRALRSLGLSASAKAGLGFVDICSAIDVGQPIMVRVRTDRPDTNHWIVSRLVGRIGSGKLKPPDTNHRLLAGIGFFDQLLRTLGLGKSALRNEFLAIASVFFRNHPPGLKTFMGSIPCKMESGAIEFEACDFERFAAFGDHLLLYPGFGPLYSEMPDALWRCHLYTLQFARTVDLAQAYYQFSKEVSDSPLEDFLRDAEHESHGCPYRWMNKLRLHKRDLPLPPADEPCS